jgi:electron transport complex protein RnfD
MLVSFGSMTVQSYPVVVDSVAGATPLALIAQGNTPEIKDLLLGVRGGAIGETCAIALLAGFVYLLVRRVITWHIPVSFVGTVYVLSLFVEGFDFMNALALILSGGLLIGAIFMATDYVTSPATPAGKLIFGIGAGLLTFLIRYFGVYPEGVSFAILFMNILTPYIESWTAHKVFGGKKA